jgi:hypothetical protein
MPQSALAALNPGNRAQEAGIALRQRTSSVCEIGPRSDDGAALWQGVDRSRLATAPIGVEQPWKLVRGFQAGGRQVPQHEHRSDKCSMSTLGCRRDPRRMGSSEAHLLAPQTRRSPVLNSFAPALETNTRPTSIRGSSPGRASSAADDRPTSFAVCESGNHFPAPLLLIPLWRGAAVRPGLSPLALAGPCARFQSSRAGEPVLEERLAPVLTVPPSGRLD